MTHPYTSLSSEKFWKTAIVDRQADSLFNNLWKPKFAISPESTIIAAGSCFAQNVGKWLSANGFTYKISEHDPVHGFSFAVGNIYTPALLRQWIEFSVGSAALQNSTAEENGKFYDLLKPSVEKEGFPSCDALDKSRRAVGAEIVQNIKSADVFIFTMGLTEAWRNKEGVVFAICPGTVCGSFDPDQHEFKNYTYSDILEDLNAIHGLLKSINPEIKMVLTVSPVPLTATASADHILTATNTSKSILRSAAHELRCNHADVDYFPSYEIIAGFPTKGIFFEDNLRSVKPEGVAYVMKHFEAGLARTTSQSNVSIKPERPSDSDELCDDVELASFQIHQPSRPDFCLIGDSHMGLLSDAFDKISLEHIGGKIMNGKCFIESNFHVDIEEYFVPLESKASRHAWSETLEQLEKHKNSSHVPIILTNIGMQTYRSVKLFFDWYGERTRNLPAANRNLTSELVTYFTQIQKGQMQIQQLLINAGYKVVMISDPPIHHIAEETKKNVEKYKAFELVYGELTKKMGGVFFDARAWVLDEFGPKKDFTTIDPATNKVEIIHGNSEYYDELAKKLKTQFI